MLRFLSDVILSSNPGVAARTANPVAIYQLLLRVSLCIWVSRWTCIYVHMRARDTDEGERGGGAEREAPSNFPQTFMCTDPPQGHFLAL